MKKAMVSRRNLCGGFLGGFLGIILFGYVHKYALPVGCLFGVVLGWWHQEIWRQITDAVQEAKNRVAKLQLHLFPTRLPKFKGLALGHKAMRIFHGFAMPFKWGKALIDYFPVWLNEKPIHRFIATKYLAAAVFVAINCTFFVLTIYLTSLLGLSETAGAIIVSPVYLMGLALFPSLDEHKSVLVELIKSYREQNTFFEKGPRFFFLDQLKKLFVKQAKWWIYISCIIAWLAGLAFLLLITVALVYAVFGLVKGFCAAITKKGYELCLAMTLIVTCTSAWFGHPYFGDARILWLTALLSGIISGYATEGLRRTILWFFDKNGRVTSTADVSLSNDLLAPIRKRLWRITLNCHAWLRNTAFVPESP